MANEKRLIDGNTKFIEKHFTKRLVDIYSLVDVIENTDWYHISPQGKLAEGANSQRNTPLYKAADIHRALANAPIVDAVEVVHGHWVSLTDCSNAGVYCSVCNKKVWKEDYAWCNRKNKLRSNYCPNCGAKMDGDGKG